MDRSVEGERESGGVVIVEGRVVGGEEGLVVKIVELEVKEIDLEGVVEERTTVGAVQPLYITLYFMYWFCYGKKRQ